MKNNKVIILLYFNDTKDFLIFNNRNEVTKYFNHKENLDNLEKKGLKSYKIIFGIIQDTYLT